MSEAQTPPESHKFARGIMAPGNFLGLAEVAKAFGLVSPEAQAALADIPFDEATLRSCRDTHILMADIGLSIIDVRMRMGRGIFYLYDDAWYNAENFAMRTEQVAWRLIRKTPVAKSANRSWAEQSALVVGSEKIPPAREVVYAIMAYYSGTGKRLFEHVSVCTIDVDSCGCHVIVGCFDERGLGIGRWNGGSPNVAIGIASSRVALSLAP